MSTNIHKLSFALYNINALIRNVIEDTVDENGIIPDDVCDQLDKLEMDKEELVQNAVLLYKEKNMLSVAIKQEEENLSNRRSILEKQTELLKDFIKKNLPEGEKITTPEYAISWRKSEAIEIDESVNAEELHEKDPNLSVKVVTYKLSKSYAKELLKTVGSLPNGFTLIKRNNIQIK